MNEDKIKQQQLEVRQNDHEEFWRTEKCKSCQSTDPNVQAWQRAVAAIEDTSDIFDTLTMAERCLISPFCQVVKFVTVSGGVRKYVTQTITLKANNYQLITKLPRLPIQCNILIISRLGQPKELEVNRQRVQKAMEYLLEHNKPYRDLVQKVDMENLQIYDKITNLV